MILINILSSSIDMFDSSIVSIISIVQLFTEQYYSVKIIIDWYNTSAAEVSCEKFAQHLNACSCCFIK